MVVTINYTTDILIKFPTTSRQPRTYYLSCIVTGDNCKGPGFESSAGDLSIEVVNSLKYSATDLSDLSD